MLDRLLSKYGYVKAERNKLGEFWYTLNTEGFGKNADYLKWSLENPVLMTIIALRAKIYSQMEIKHLDSNGVVIENSPVVKLLNTPNYFQSREDFLFQQMWFMSACGQNYTYKIKTFRGELPKALFNLVPSEIDLNKTDKVKKFIFTKSDFQAYGQREIIYKLDDEKTKIRLENIIPFYDLANGIGNNKFMTSPSRVQGIEKVLQNIDENLKAKHVNLQMSQKFLGKNASDGNEAQLLDEDKKLIERTISNRNFIATNRANMDVTHLVSDLKRLYLDEQFSQDALKSLLAFDMNKDVLNYFGAGSSTFENQEKGELRYLQNSIIPTAKATMNSFAQDFGLFELGEKLVPSYDHLNIMQPVINEKIDTLKKMEEVIKLGLENGTMTPDEAQKMSKDLRTKLML
jgi:hypothetical protein